jgi:arsenate reductase-like glutaredoxin family protein
MKNERDKYKKLYQESQERVKEAIVKRDAVIERLNVKIEQLQREAENVIVKENVMSIPIGVPGGQVLYYN